MSAHLSDDRYKISGTNIMNWTKFSRENIPKRPPKFRVGDEVIIVSLDEIKSVGQDCDGTTLYGTLNHGHGYPAAALVPCAIDFEYDNSQFEDDEPDLQELVAALKALGWTVEPPAKKADQ